MPRDAVTNEVLEPGDSSGDINKTSGFPSGGLAHQSHISLRAICLSAQDTLSLSNTAGTKLILRLFYFQILLFYNSS